MPNEVILFLSALRRTEMNNMINHDHVLVISPETEHHKKINTMMKKCGFSVFGCTKFDEARNVLAKEKFRMVFCYDTLPDGDFRDVVAAVNPTPVIVLSRFAEWDHYIAALRAGAFDYITCPPDPAETERIVRSAMGNAIRRDRVASCAP
jgi:DNA-binding NtrC family response regulator